MTLVDSLDTLWLMGMETEFADAKEWVQNSLNFEKHASISVFEITIRELGGLLGAYDLSGMCGGALTSGTQRSHLLAS